MKERTGGNLGDGDGNDAALVDIYNAIATVYLRRERKGWDMILLRIVGKLPILGRV